MEGFDPSALTEGILMMQEAQLVTNELLRANLHAQLSLLGAVLALGVIVVLAVMWR